MIDLKDYPKSKEIFYEHVKKWLLQLQKELLKDVPETQAPEITDRIVELGANNILNQNFRSLYHFFDGVDINLFITKGFGIKIMNKGKESVDYADEFKTREEAELFGFKECFKMLESTIKLQ